MTDREKALEAFEKWMSYSPIAAYGEFNPIEIIRAALTQPIVTGWMGIESCPKNESHVLFYCDSAVRKGYANEYGFFIVNNGDYHDGGYGSDYKCDDKNKSSDYGYSLPTHWMPLPKPPVSVIEGAE